MKSKIPGRIFDILSQFGLVIAAGIAGGAVLGGSAPQAYAQNIEGQIIASQYGQFRVQGYAPDTYTFAPTACRVQGGASFFPAFTVGTPILIVDGNPALSEVVTPTQVTINSNTCVILVAPVHHHSLPFYLTSATGGLQEAINSNLTSPNPNTIVLNNSWYSLGGDSTVIANAKGSPNLGLIDVTSLPSTWYRWNGVQYVIVPVASNVTSVFSRTGDITAQSGDYTCAEVTGCLTSAPVTSVFGRTGSVTAQTGDYICLQISGCGAASQWNGLLTVAQGQYDTTAYVSVGAGTLPLAGYFLIDAEWEYFSGSTSLGSGEYELTGVIRQEFVTTAAAHSSGSYINSMVFPLAAPSQSLFAFVGGGAPSYFAINCPTGNSYNGQIVFEVGCPGSGFGIFTSGGFIDWSDLNYLTGSLVVGYAPTAFPNLDSSEPIAHTSQVLQSVYPNIVTSQISFANGIPDEVDAIQAPAAAAPVLFNHAVPTGNTTNTYVCTGTDRLGENIPGVPASVSGLAASGWGVANVMVYCQIPGAATVSLYRTAGVPNIGLVDTEPGATLNYQDGYATATGGSPSATNTTFGHLCTNDLQFCELSGAGSAPPVACSSSTHGYLYHNVSATATPFAEVCNGTSWVTAY